MWSKLPREVLELIFTDPAIENKDLLELQLTCKPWGYVAQRYLYQQIQLQDPHNPSRDNDPSAALMKRYNSLIQSLLFNGQAGNYIKKLDTGALFYGHTSYDSQQQVGLLSSNMALLAQLCPNLTHLYGRFDDAKDYLKNLSLLHREGYFQRLEKVNIPVNLPGSGIATYHSTLLEFKDTLKQMVILAGASNEISIESLIPPTSLQLFTSAERVSLLYPTRVHLCGIKDYASNCGPHVRSLHVYMPAGTTTTAPPQDEYYHQLDVQPQEHIQELIVKRTRLTTSELAFIVCMFPSLKNIYIDAGVLDEINFNHADVRVMIRVFYYLSRIAQLHYQFQCRAISTGLDLLPHLARATDVKQLSISISNVVRNGSAEIYVKLTRAETMPAEGTPKRSTVRETNKGLNARIEIRSTELQASFARALEGLRGKSIESIMIESRGMESSEQAFNQVVEQQSMDYILDHYKGMQKLTFKRIAFPSQAPTTAKQAVKYVHYLHLDECEITEDYFDGLSRQFERIDHFKFSSDQWCDMDINSNSDNMEKEIRVYLPHTAIGTITLEIHGAVSYSIKVRATADCMKLKVALLDQTNQTITREEASNNNDGGKRLANDLQP
ncbi:hypothetical protein MBANPS3_003903 [Mucor bainieri]